jgi:hypothetical protein
MGGTGLEPVTPSLSILRIDCPRLADTHEKRMFARFGTDRVLLDRYRLVPES